MSYYTKKVLAFTEMAKTLGMQQELMVLKVLRQKSDVIALLVNPRNPNLIEKNKVTDHMLDEFIKSVSHVTKTIYAKIKELSSPNFYDDFYSKMKACPSITNDDQFKLELNDLIDGLKQEVSSQSDIKLQ